jgi:hypothetical protein
MKMVDADDPDAALDQGRPDDAERKREARSNATDVRRLEVSDCDPVDQLFQSFRRLDAGQRARLLRRIEWRWGS